MYFNFEPGSKRVKGVVKVHTCGQPHLFEGECALLEGTAHCALLEELADGLRNIPLTEINAQSCLYSVTNLGSETHHLQYLFEVRQHGVLTATKYLSPTQQETHEVSNDGLRQQSGCQQKDLKICRCCCC